ncbi:MAG TPA: hypothetical protein G4O00_06155 [Thermoflexia bacterium]|jgi:hypothetical protein|nr:hypothetical protein [Thermoflexia bacterium]
MSKTTVRQTRIPLRRAIEEISETLVRMADEALSEGRMKALKGRGFKSGQLDNLLGVAMETESPYVVKNWVRYQMGRRSDRSLRGWSETGLGEQVVKDLDALEGDARRIARDVFGEETPENIRRVHIALVRRYVGYLRRWFVAKGGKE